MHHYSNIPYTKVDVPFSLLNSYKSLNPGPRQLFMIRKKNIFYGELSTPRPNPSLLSATSTLHIGGCFSTRNLRRRHAVVTGKHLSQRVELTVFKGVIKFSGQ
jgi:hypothetical protein